MGRISGQETTHEDELWEEFEGHMRFWDPTNRPVDTMANNIWQLNQSSATKTLNLEHDFDELSTRAREFGRSGEDDNRRAWIEKQQTDGERLSNSRKEETCALEVPE